MSAWILWVIAGGILLVVEMVTPGIFFFSCFGISAFAAAWLAYYQFPVLLIWGVFLICSLILVLVARPLVMKLVKGENRASNVDELLGKEAVILKPIRPHYPGLVKVGGEMWKAKSEQEISEGSIAIVTQVEGTCLIVRKK